MSKTLSYYVTLHSETLIVLLVRLLFPRLRALSESVLITLFGGPLGFSVKL